MNQAILLVFLCVLAHKYVGDMTFEQFFVCVFIVRTKCNRVNNFPESKMEDSLLNFKK